MLIKFFIFAIFAIVFVSFLILAKTLGNLSIIMGRLEYLLSREYELLQEKEAVKKILYGEETAKEEKAKNVSSGTSNYTDNFNR